MNKKLIPLVVQLKQNNNYIVQGINQNDAGIIFDIKVMDGLESFDFSGYAVVALKIKKPDETYLVDSNTGSYLDIIDPVKGRLKINIPTSCTAQNGMHFCQVTFGMNATTVFATMSFNYFVGDSPNPADEDIIGTDEFPILVNLIAEASDMKSNEDARLVAEEERIANELDRKATAGTLIAAFTDSLEILDNAVATAQSMLAEIYQMLAEGGSVDVSQLTALATKTWVNDKVRWLDYDEIQGILQINRQEEGDYSQNLSPGQFMYCIEPNKLYIGDDEGHAVLVNHRGHVVSGTEPTDTTLLWIDTSEDAPVIKFYDPTAEDWVACNTACFG